jgi:hypothetical protein
VARDSRVVSWVDQVVREALIVPHCQRILIGSRALRASAALPISSSRNLPDLPLKRTRGQGRGVANTQIGDLLVLLLKVLLGKRIELCAILLFDRGSFAVELLDLVEPRDAIIDPGVGSLEAILVLVSIELPRQIDHHSKQ